MIQIACNHRSEHKIEGLVGGGAVFLSLCAEILKCNNMVQEWQKREWMQ